MKSLIIMIFYFFVLSCDSPSLPFIYDIEMKIERMDGSTRDVMVYKDTLFVANESHGILMYKINAQMDKIESIEKIWDNTNFSQSQGKSFRRVAFDTTRKVVYGVDNFDYTYFIDLLNLAQEDNLIDNPNIALCTGATNNVTRISLLNNYTETSKSEFLALFKNKGSAGSWAKLSKIEVSFDEDPEIDNLFTPSLSCNSNNQLENLNYNITDIDLIEVTNEDITLVGLSNSSSVDHMAEIYSFDNNGFLPLDTMFFNSRPNTIKFFNQQDESVSVAVGLSEGGGCYIELLDPNGKIIQNSNRLHIANGYSVLDIEVVEDEILLSLGINGVQVYTLDGVFKKGIVSGHAYSSDRFKNSYIVGTKNGIEVFN